MRLRSHSRPNQQIIVYTLNYSHTLRIYAGMCLSMEILNGRVLTNRPKRLGANILPLIFDLFLVCLAQSSIQTYFGDFYSIVLNVYLSDEFALIAHSFFFSFSFVITETVSISDQGPQGIIWGPLKLTLFIEEAQMYLCFNKRWRLVPSVSKSYVTPFAAHWMYQSPALSGVRCSLFVTFFSLPVLFICTHSRFCNLKKY